MRRERAHSRGVHQQVGGHRAPRRLDHYCAKIETIVAGDARDCVVCLGRVTGDALEQHRRALRKRRDRGEYKRELWIPSNA